MTHRIHALDMGRLRRARYSSAGLLPNWDLARETPSITCSTVSSASISTPSSSQLGGFMSAIRHRPPQAGAGSWHSRPRPTPARPHRRHSL